MWDWIPNVHQWGSCWIALFSRLAKVAHGEIDWAPHIDFLFHHLIRATKLAVTQRGNMPHDTFPEATLRAFTGHDQRPQITEFGRAGRFIPWLITDEASSKLVLDRLEDFLNQLKPYFHPSNTGHWSHFLISFLCTVCSTFCKRIKKEAKHPEKTVTLTPQIQQRFVSIMLPFLNLSAYSKQSFVSSYAAYAIGLLAAIDPVQTFAGVIERIRYNLASLNSAKQISHSITTAGMLITRKSLKEPSTIQQLGDLMLELLPGIDLNDPIKTMATLKFYRGMLLHVPLYSDGEFEVSDEFSGELVDARQRFCSILSDWAVLFLDQSLNFLHHAEKGFANKIGSFGWSRIAVCLFMQIPSELLKTLTTKLIHFVCHNQTVGGKSQVGVFLSSAVLANPPLVLPMVFSLTREILNNKKTELKGSEKKIVWIISMIGRAIIHAGDHILPFMEQIELLISLASDPLQPPTVNSGACSLLGRLLDCLTTKYPTEYRSLPPKIWNSPQMEANHWKYWAPEDCEVEPTWHVPSGAEIDAAKRVINKFGRGTAFKVLTDYTKTPCPTPDDPPKFPPLNREHSFHIEMLWTMLKHAGTMLPNPRDASSDTFDESQSSGYDKPSYSCIPIDLQDNQFRDEVTNIILSVAKIQVEQQHDFVKATGSLLAVIETLLTVRLLPKTKSRELVQKTMYGKKYSGVKDPVNPKKHLVPRIYAIEKELTKYQTKLQGSNYGLPFGDPEKQLFRAMIDLFLFHYKNLKPHFIVQCFVCTPRSAAYFLPDIIKKLSQADASETEIEAALCLLREKHVMRSILRKWELIELFLKSITQGHVHPKATIQSRLFGLFEVFCTEFHCPAFDIPMPSDVPDHLIEKKKNIIQLKNEKNYHFYIQCFQHLESLLDSTPHWRYKIMCLSGLLAIFKNNSRQGIPTSLIKILLNQIGTEQQLPIIRTFSYQLLLCLLKSFRSHPKAVKDWSSYNTLIPPMAFKDLPKPTPQTWSHFQFLNKSQHCWNGGAVQNPSARSITVVSQQQIDEVTQILRSELLNDQYFERLLQHLKEDHNISHEEQTKLSKQNELTYGPLALSLGINLDGLLCQGGNNGETYGLMGLFIGENVDFPETRSYTTPFGTSFSRLNARLIETLTRWIGMDFVEKIRPYSLQYASELNPTQQAFASEIFAGVLRATKTIYDWDTFEEMTKYLALLLTTAINTKTSQETGNDWSSAIRWGTANVDPRKLVWMQNVLLNGLLGPVQPVLQQIKQLRLVHALIEELSWRGLEFSDEVLRLVNPQLNHSLQLLRNDLAGLLYTIMSTALIARRGADGKPNERGLVNTYPAHHAFLAEVLTQLPRETSAYKETILAFVLLGLLRLEAIDFYMPLISPCIILQTEQEEAVKELAKKVSAVSHLVHIPPKRFDSFIGEIQKAIQLDNWHISRAMSPLLQVITFNHRFLFGAQHFQKVFSMVNSLLGHSRPEVQEPAKNAIASLIMTQGEQQVHLTLKHFRECLKVKLPSRNNVKTKEGQDAINRIAEGLLGMSGLVKSQPYDVPEWLPEVLVDITEYLNSPAPLNKISSECLKEFWRTHTDEWVLHQQRFTYEQIQTIKQTNTTEYYA